MAISGNVKMIEMVKVVSGLGPVNPSTSTPDYVCMKGYQRCMIVFHIENGTATPGAVSLLQASDVSATGAKTLGFDWVWINVDTAGGSAFTKTAVTSDTFTPSTDDDETHLYVVDVGIEDFDTANGFDCFRAVTADATAAVTSVMYYLYPAPFARDSGALPDPITDQNV